MSATSPASVTVEDVRMELGDVESELDTELLHHHLRQAEAHLLRHYDGTASPAELDSAIALEAAWRVVSANRDYFVSSKSAADVSKNMDIEEWIATLRERREAAIGIITGSGRPRLRTLGGR